MQWVYSFMFLFFLQLGELISVISSEKVKLKTTVEYINEAGYLAETHTVVTKDSIIINFFRIVPPSYKGLERPVVILQHGLQCSSSTWVFAGPKNGLGFALVNAGYDVWLTNVRGNTYARNTTNGATVSWQFSFHEMGLYDLPAQIDYILDKTEANKVFFIGYSMGTTAFFVMTSTETEYNEKISGMIALAPVAFMKHVKGFTVRVVKFFSSFIAALLKLFHVNIVFGEPPTIKGQYLFDIPIVGRIYYFILGTVMGSNKAQYDKNLVSRFLQTMPVGSSFKVFQHYLQLMDSGAFRYYGYGDFENLLKYWRLTPPDYKLENIKVPIILFQGRNDYLSTNEDISKLQNSLISTKVTREHVDDDNFTHLDFVWAKDVDRLVNQRVVKAMEPFKENNSIVIGASNPNVSSIFKKIFSVFD